MRLSLVSPPPEPVPLYCTLRDGCLQWSNHWFSCLFNDHRNSYYVIQSNKKVNYFLFLYWTLASIQYLHTQQYNIIYVYLFSTLPVHVCFVFRQLRLPNPSPVNRILWRLHFHEQLKQTKINTETKHENSIHHHDIFEYTTLNMKKFYVVFCMFLGWHKWLPFHRYM